MVEALHSQKASLKKDYEMMVGREGMIRARRNSHSRRKPIQCGLTIHPGSDCAYSCVYCYIPDMGFRFKKPEPCELSPEELALALLYNPNFVAGRNGTYIAVGSIVEPFQPELKALTMSYIRELAKLGNPIQFSTKSMLSSGEAVAMALSCNRISPLITIITLDDSKARMLEPRAPPPHQRLAAIRNLANSGLKPFLFLRPIIPGIVTVDECLQLIGEAEDYGAAGVVLGNFRVTRRIIDAMRGRQFDLSEVVKRVGVIDSRQRAVAVSDMQMAIEKGLSSKVKVYRRSCCASAFSAGLEHCAHENMVRGAHDGSNYEKEDD